MRMIIILALLCVSSYSFAETSDNAASTIEVKAGKEFVITMDANVTTGYGWQLAGPVDESLIRVVNSEYVPDKTGIVGSGGKSTWTFKAVRAGRAQILFKYVRPWEKDTPPVKEATYIVDIKNA